MSAPAPRRPLPRPIPTTLVELVLDLEARSPGEPDAEVQLPAQEWVHLVARAQQEQASPIGYRPGAVTDPAVEQWAASLAEVRGELARTRAAKAELEGELATLRAMNLQVERNYDTARRDLAEAVGWGPLNGIDELLQVVRGYVMALDEEREANDWPISLALESEALAAVGDAARKEMVKALGIGVDTEWADVVQITQGYVMAHHVEQQLLNEAIAVAGSTGGEGTEVYCRSCKAFFPAGTHTHAVAAKGRKQKAQAELADQ